MPQQLASRPADSTAPLHPLMAERWSPRAFDSASVSDDEVRTLLEAMRWSPSCFNDQPWQVLVFHKHDGPAREQAEACLMEGNAWAKEAPLLLLTACRTAFAFNGKPNAHAQHDLGLGTMSLVLQAHSMGLASHQMAGFDRERANELFGFPDDVEPMVMIALGHPGDSAGLPEELQQREQGPRVRNPLSDFAWRGRHGGDAAV